jgi:XTP/dITP diphosphohydrolase
MRFRFDDLVAIMARLRGPGGCPWDREQTHASLGPYLLEETHEVLEAIARDDPAALREELGDLLLQVVFHAEISREAGGFNVDDVTDALTRKLIDRHPHVFASSPAATPDEVLAQWHALKREEAPSRGPLDGVPASLPSLARAQKLVGRAVAGGLRAPTPVPDAVDGARVRLEEFVRAAERHGRSGRGAPADDALGALLLAVVEVATATGIDAESALRAACIRFAGTAAAPHPMRPARPARPAGPPRQPRRAKTIRPRSSRRTRTR